MTIIVLDLTSKTAIQGVLSVANAGGATEAEVQISDNPNMLFGLIVSRDWNIAGGNITINGLNQSSQYYVRARAKLGAGVYDEWSNIIGFTTLLSAVQTYPVGQLLLDTALIVPPEPLISLTLAHPVAGYPVENVTVDDPNAECWVNMDANSSNIVIETGGAPVDTLAILGTNLPEAASILWSAFNTKANAIAGTAVQFSAPSIAFRASTNLPQRRHYHSIQRLAAPQSYRWWRLDFSTGAASMLNIASIGEIVMGLARKTKNISADKIETPIDLGSAERNRDGTIDRRYGHRGRKVDFEISFLRETQFQTEYADLWSRLGNTSPVLVVPNSKANAFLHDRILYGILSQSRTQNPRAPFFTQSFSCESIY